MKILCSTLLVFQLCLVLVAADTTPLEECSLAPRLVGKASIFNFGFKPRCGFQSLAQFLVLSGVPEEDVKSSLQDVGNPKQLTLFENLSGFIADNVVALTIASQSSIDVAVTYSIWRSMAAIPPLVSYCPNYLDASPQNLVAQGNVAGNKRGYQFRVQAFETKDAVIQRIKSQLEDKKPVMALIHDKAVGYFNIVSCQGDNFIYLNEDGEAVLIDKDMLLSVMDYNSTLYKRGIKNSLKVLGSNMGQFTIIEEGRDIPAEPHKKQD